MLLRNIFADAHRVESLHVRDAFEKENPLDEGVGVPHFLDRLLMTLRGQLRVSPVLAHLSVDEELVDRGQFGAERLVQDGDDFGFSFHSNGTSVVRFVSSQPL